MYRADGGGVMNVLEKILEEINKRRCNLIDMSDEEPELCDVDDWYNEGVDEGKIKAYFDVEQIIRSYMNDIANVNADNWIPVSERLPEEHDSIFARFKGTDKWDDAMFEKISDSVNVTVEFECGARETKVSCTVDGKWRCEKEPVKKTVIAWQPLPEAYKGG